MLAAGPAVPAVHSQAIRAPVDLRGPDLDQLQQPWLQAAGPDHALQSCHGLRGCGTLLVVVDPHRCCSSFPRVPACVPGGTAAGAAFGIWAFLTPAGASRLLAWRAALPVTPGPPPPA